MIVVDTSVAVAAALPWHQTHAAAVSALPRTKTRLLGHVAVETYSVLTRLPPPQRVPAAVAREYLTQEFTLPVAVLSPDRYERLLEVAAAEAIVGGGVYDAVVGATAVDLGATLLTLDRRALATYQLLEVDYRLVG